jgi:dTDP-4-dehydrorhamnose reductase
MYEITKEFIEDLNLNIKLEDAPSRHNLWMNCSKARKYGVEFSEVSEGLRLCLQDYASKLN